MNNLLEKINSIFFKPSAQIISIQTNQDPVSKLLSSLYSYRGIEVNIKSKDDVFIEDFFQKQKNNSVRVNIDEDLKLFSKPNRMPNFFNSQRQAEFPTQQQKAIMSKLKKVPIYTIVNGYNEIVIASPRSMPPKNSIEWLYDKYYDNFLWREDNGSISLGLFFVNKEDAETYLQEICKKDPKGAEDIGLNVKVVGLDTFYELNRTSKPRMQAKLVADLEEIDSLLNDYFRSDLLHFHPKQKCRKQWFQGNPIYLMKISDKMSNLDKKNFTLFKYNFDTSASNNTKVLLFKKNDAYKVWDFYKSKNKDLKLPEKPVLEIYNLENYLLDLEKGNVNLTEQTIFIPSYDSYLYSKQLVHESKIEKEISMQEKVETYINTRVKSLQRFYKGIVWLITSDTLPAEENSW